MATEATPPSRPLLKPEEAPFDNIEELFLPEPAMKSNKATISRQTTADLTQQEEPMTQSISAQTKNAIRKAFTALKKTKKP